MLTNLDFIRPGAQWPPPGERERLERYEAHRRLFMTGHGEVYEAQLRRIQREIGDFGDIVSYGVALNYQRLISLKTADLLVGEPPEIGAADDMRTRRVRELLERCAFVGLLHQCAIDISRYGDALLTVGRDANGRGRIGIGQPSTWFPVADPANIREFGCHVIAWAQGQGRGDQRLNVQLHYPGRYDCAGFALAGGAIGRQLSHWRTVMTGLDGFALFPLRGVLTSDSVYGHDDYTAVDSVVSEMIVVVGQISRILDKHADPSMQGPLSALEEKDGQYAVRAGRYFIKEHRDDPDVGYLTWDGQLSAAFEQLRQLRNQLYALSELGSALLGDPDGMGGVESARALRLRLLNPLVKVARIAANITPAVKEAVAACVSLDTPTGLKLAAGDISVKWFDGLPNDEQEEQALIQTQNGGKPTMSQLRSVMRANRMAKDEAEKELEAIRGEA
jgi:hypothetical protein